MDEAAIRSELTDLRAQQRRLTDRIIELENLLSYPTVIPVLVFDRYGSRESEESFWADEDDENPLQQAWDELCSMEDNGQCAGVGIEVGGHLHTRESLRDRFGRKEFA